MAHPRMYDDEDPVLERLRAVCLGFSGAEEHESHGRPTFRTKKIFAVYGGMEKGGSLSALQYPKAMLVKVDPHGAGRLLDQDRFFLPAYYGPSGWVGLDLSVAPVDWEEVRELVEDSYRLTAPKSLVAKLDA